MFPTRNNLKTTKFHSKRPVAWHSIGANVCLVITQKCTFFLPIHLPITHQTSANGTKMKHGITPCGMNKVLLNATELNRNELNWKKRTCL